MIDRILGSEPIFKLEDLDGPVVKWMAVVAILVALVYFLKWWVVLIIVAILAVAAVIYYGFLRTVRGDRYNN